MTRCLPLALSLFAFVAAADPAAAQSQPRPRPAQQSRSIHIGGYGMFGLMNFTAVDTFDAILGQPSGNIYGGGATVGLPLGGLFVDIGAWRFKQVGERVFITNGEVFHLDIPVTITITPVEITAGWKFRWRNSRLVPYAGGGITLYGYKETSSFSTPAEDVDERFNGYHVIGGVEYKVLRWLGLGGEAAWTTIPDAIGTGGASKEFGESDLGGTSFRAKITIGR
jgi:opacity protein-like surface antigen